MMYMGYSPENWVKLFPTIEAFKRWCFYNHSIFDLYNLQDEYAEHELYAHWFAMEEVIEEKISIAIWNLIK